MPDATKTDRFQSLCTQIRQFDQLPAEVVKDLAASARLQRYAAGQVIYLEGEPAEAVYLLQRGWVKATRMSRSGREQAMLFLQAGEVFGDVAVFLQSPYPGTVTALEAVEVWVLPGDDFLKLVTRHASLALAVIRRLSERVLHYIRLVEDLSLRSVEQRLANTLLQHAEVQAGQLVVPRRHWATFDEMAVRLGTVRDVLSRALKTLETEGYLRVEKHSIVLLDPAGLQARGEV